MNSHDLLNSCPNGAFQFRQSAWGTGSPDLHLNLLPNQAI